MHWIDPTCLPTVDGRVSRFTLNPRGDVDGVLPDDTGRSFVRVVDIDEVAFADAG